MPSALSNIAAKDGAAATITGGILAVDKSGTAAGPYFAAQTIVDTQGVNTATVKAASTAPAATDTAVVVAVSPNTPTLPVSLTSTTVTGTVAVTESGTWTVQPGNTANTTAWKMQLYDGTTALPILAASTGAPAASAPALAVSLRDTNVNVQGGAPVTVGAVVPTATANGATAARIVASASGNTANFLKASAGQIYAIDVFNTAAYTVFLKLYNKASAPTVGTDTPVWTIPIPAGGGYSKEFPRGKTFSTGIAYAITKLQADSDATALVAGDLTGTIDWI